MWLVHCVYPWASPPLRPERNLTSNKVFSLQFFVVFWGGGAGLTISLFKKRPTLFASKWEQWCSRKCICHYVVLALFSCESPPPPNHFKVLPNVTLIICERSPRNPLLIYSLRY